MPKRGREEGREGEKGREDEERGGGTKHKLGHLQLNYAKIYIKSSKNYKNLANLKANKKGANSPKP